MPPTDLRVAPDAGSESGRVGAEPAEAIRVVVIWPSGVWRQGCAAVLAPEPGLDVTEVNDLAEFARLGLDAVDVAIVGVNSAALDDGTRVVRTLADDGYRVLAVIGSRVSASLVLQAGAFQCLSGPTLDEIEFVACVRAVARGDRCDPGDFPPVPVLSPREREVLEKLASGRTDKEIARTLDISVRTVQSHLDRIRGKTQRHRRAELTALAYELGLGPRPEGA